MPFYVSNVTDSTAIEMNEPAEPPREPVPTPMSASVPVDGTDVVAEAPAAAAPATTAPAATAASRIQSLHPGWFASVMGTAIVAVATYQNPGNVSGLVGVAHAVGIAFSVVAYALGVVLTVAFAIRWVRHSDASLADLRHPVLGAMHGTLPGGLLVLAVMTSAVGTAYLPEQLAVGLVAVLAVVGIAIALVLSVAFSITLFSGRPPADAVNGGWLIPPVVTIIIPMVLVPLMPHVSPGNARLLLALGYAALGMGFLLYLFVMGLLHDRLVLHPLPPSALAPSLWIGLGPIGVAVLASLALARAGHTLFGPTAASVSMISLLIATALWGFGLWWYAAAATLLVRYLRAGRLPFHLGWWGFTFPLGAFTVATLNVARAWEAPVIEAVGVLLFASLIGFWTVVATRTVQATASGKVWDR